MWNYKEPNWNVEIWFFFKAYLETLVKKPRVPGTGGQAHFICICQSQLVLIEYCLGLSKRRKLPEGEIHILFVH